MAKTPRYIVRPVSSGYTVRRSDTRATTVAALWGSAGFIGVTYGLLRRDKVGACVGFVGAAAACYAAATAADLVPRLVTLKPPRRPRARPDKGPSYARESSAIRQSPHDKVEEAQMQSFPASDPPAH